MDTQTLRAQAFKALHERKGAFVIPNPWDAGSAKMLASLGFEALATTSAGYAFSRARPDGGLTLDETLLNVQAIVAASDLPVAVDLENGFADNPAECATSILR
ncbi:2-methylisocitrate lyase, partial [Pseudomonas sp. MWU12-2312b]